MDRPVIPVVVTRWWTLGVVGPQVVLLSYTNVMYIRLFVWYKSWIAWRAQVNGKLKRRRTPLVISKSPIWLRWYQQFKSKQYTSHRTQDFWWNERPSRHFQIMRGSGNGRWPTRTAIVYSAFRITPLDRSVGSTRICPDRRTGSIRGTSWVLIDLRWNDFKNKIIFFSKFSS